MMSRNLLLVAVTGALAGWLPTADAQKKVVLTTGQNQTVEIPLTGTAQINSQGDILATCQPTNGACPNIAGNLVAPTITGFENLSVTAPGQASLPWSTTGADACYGKSVVRTSASGPAAPTVAWSTAQAAAGSFSLTALYNSVGAGNSATYEFTLHCYSSAPAGTAPNLGVGVAEKKAVVTLAPPQGGTQPSGNCQTYLDGLSPEARAHYDEYKAENRGFTSAGTFTFFQKTNRTLGVNTGLIGAAGGVLPGVLGDNQYLAMSFTLPPESGANTGRFNLNFYQPLAGGFDHNIVATISPCPGDFRPREIGSADPYLTTYCRKDFSMGGSVRGNTVADNLRCHLPANQQLYINVSLRNLYLEGDKDSLPPDICPNSTTCGAAGTLTN